ncbi:MAG: hypothetical protein HQ568_09835 [Calditrichaeota bacterium]|nr:hypothetical protein [Calditrichota bacterium]
MNKENKNNNIFKSQSIQEMIDEQIHSEGGLKTKPVKPLSAPVLALSHTAIYMMHRYWARRPHNVFAHIIQHYTNPGDLVLDPFCGGGVTVVESLKLRRRVVGIDINPLATWITQVEVESVDLDKLEKAFNEWYVWCEEQVSSLFRVECGKCGNKDAQAEWYEWSNVVICPDCGREVVLAEAEKKKNSVYLCPHQGCVGKFRIAGIERRDDKMMLVKTRCERCEKTEIREPYKSDLRLAREIARDERRTIKNNNLFIPDDKFPDMDRMRDDALHLRGISHFSRLFTSRQRIAIAQIRKWLENNLVYYDEKNELLHVFSIMLRFCNKMVFRSSGWQGGNPVEWAKHAYWLPNIFNELNPLFALKKKFKSLQRGKKKTVQDIGQFYKNAEFRTPLSITKGEKTCSIITRSSDDIPLPDESIDTIITDPPFGGNVQYLELSDFFLVWIRDIVVWGGVTNKNNEAIQTRNLDFEGSKNLEHYENMLYKIFKECRRTLKSDGHMVMTFHNTDVRVWMALHNAVKRAGFRLPTYKESLNRGVIYQPAVKNYTQTIHQRMTGSLLGDFILTFIPTEIPADTEALRMQLTLDEENALHKKCKEVIRYHWGLDEPSLWSAILPYLHDSGLLGRILQFDFKILLQSGPFVCQTVNKKKMWYMKDMMENGHLKGIDVIEAEKQTLIVVQNYFQQHQTATMDDLLKAVYSQLVNSQLPKLETIQKILNTYCIKRKSKVTKREEYIWKTGKKSDIDIARVRASQNHLDLDAGFNDDHNTIIEVLASSALDQGFDVHAGKTEQRKSPALKELSVLLTGLELGLPPVTFKLIKEIDLLILKDNHIQAAIEVVMTLSTFNKAINDRFRNLLEVVSNWNYPLITIVRDEDYKNAMKELRTPANLNAKLPDKVRVLKLSQLSMKNPLQLIL